MSGRIVPVTELTRYRDHRGMFHQSCPHCNCLIILFDDDEHWCDDAPTEEKQYTVSVSCFFDALSPSDAVLQMVGWLLDEAHNAGYRVDLGDETWRIDAETLREEP